MKNEIITINANILSVIEWCIHFKENTTNLPEYMKEKSIYIDSDTEKNIIIEYFNNCKKFLIKDEEIIFYFDISEEEIKNYFLESEKNLKIRIKILAKYYNNIKFKESIIKYCKKYNLVWLLIELENN